ncbi:MAG: hypothetical protein H7343_16810 [Undibacterium sp.]|nr:hypothetical protein [Opitutaceae bacterium]
MCLECLQFFGVPLDPAHHAQIKPRPNRHARRITRARPVPSATETATPAPTPQPRRAASLRACRPLIEPDSAA